MPISSLPNEVLLMIMKELHHSAPSPAVWDHVFDRSPVVQLSTPTDPVSSLVAARVCRRWRAISKSCSDVWSTVVVQLPLVRRHRGPRRVFTKDHLTQSIHRLPLHVHPRLRVFIGEEFNYADAQQRNANLDRLRPAVNRAQSIVLHGYNPGPANWTSASLSECIPLGSFTPTHLQSFSLDYVVLLDATNDYSLQPLLDFIALCPVLCELKVYRVMASPVPVHGTIAMPFLRNIEFTGQLAILTNLLGHVQSSSNMRTAFTPCEDDQTFSSSPDYPWREIHPPSISTQASMAPFVLRGAGNAVILSTLHIFSNITSLEIFKSVLNDDFFDQLPNLCPLLTRMSLVECKFVGDDAVRMYKKHHVNSMMPEYPLSSLCLLGCNVQGFSSSELLAALQNFIFHILVDDKDMREVASCERLSVEPAPQCPLFEVASEDEFGDPQESSQEFEEGQFDDASDADDDEEQ